MKNKQLQQNIPNIKVISTKENPDGSLDIEVEYQKDWVDLVKFDLKKKKVTKEEVKKHFIDLVIKGVSKILNKKNENDFHGQR